MKKIKWGLFILFFLSLFHSKSLFSQNAPGGTVTNGNTFITAIGGADFGYSIYQGGVYSIYITQDVFLSSPIVVQSGFFKLIPDSNTRIIAPAGSISHLIEVKVGTGLILQGRVIETDTLTLTISGTHNQYQTSSHLIKNYGSLAFENGVIVEEHHGESAAIYNEGNISLYGGLIRNNSSTNDGGAIILHKGNGMIDGVHFLNNSAPRGSAIKMEAAAFLMLNKTDLNGGTVFLNGEAHISVNPFFISDEVVNIQKASYQRCSEVVAILGNPSTEKINYIKNRFLVQDLPSTFDVELNTGRTSLILNSIAGTDYVRTCEQYYFEPLDTLFTQSTTFIHRFATPGGCDSIVEIEVDIRPFFEEINLSICANETPYRLENTFISESGTYTFTYLREDGCDSVLTYHVTLIPTVIDTVQLRICDSELPLTYRNTVLTQSGEYLFESACSSYRLLILEVFPTFSDTVRVVMCDTDAPYVFDEQHIYNETGIYNIEYSSVEGCDSIVVIDLTIYTPFQAEIIGGGQVCDNESYSLTATGGEQFLWNTGEETESIVPQSTGIYSVTVTDQLSCYQSVATSTILIKESPTLEIPPLAPFCDYDSITITPSTNADLLIWNNGLISPNYVAHNADTIVVKAQNNNGCYRLETIVPAVIPAPEIEFDAIFDICIGESTQIEVSSGYQYVWSTGDTEGMISVTPLETTTYTVTLTSTYGCSYVDSVTIFVHYPPTVEIVGDPERCEGDHNPIVATGGTNYIWSNGLESDSLFVTESGIYTVTVSDQYGCYASTNVSVVIHPIPTLSVVENQYEICNGDSIQLIVSSDATLLWSTGDTQDSIFVRPDVTTYYSVTATNEYNCVVEDSVLVIVNDLPEAELITPDPFCDNEIAMLVVVGEEISNYSLLWSTGETQDTIEVSEAATYSLTLIDEKGCSTILSTEVQTIPAAQVSISGDSVKCVGQSTQFTVHGDGDYFWSTGDTSATITVTDAGLYTVTVTAANGCTTVKSINFVQSEPQVVITGDTDICAGESTVLTASGGTSYKWSVDNQTSPTVYLAPAQTSFYYVTVTNALGCTTVKLITLNVHPNPTATVIGETSICQGETTMLTAGGGDSYVWSTGEQTAGIEVSTSGHYVVTVSNQYGCTSTKMTAVEVKAKPMVTILGTPSFCQGGSTQLTATGGSSYMWSNGVATQTNSITIPGTYTVTVTASNGCTTVATVPVVMNPKPTPVITGNRSFCSNASTILTASGGTTYQWNDGTTDSVMNATSAGIYTVTVTNDAGCSAAISATTTVYPAPTPSISGGTEFCSGSSINLIASGGSSYVWSNGSTGSYITVSQTGTYSVTATDSRGCTGEVSKTVVAHPLPNIVITGDTNICTGESAFLMVNAASGSTYVWSNGQTTPFINVTPTTSTNYTVVVTNSNGCTKSATIRVNVRPYPVITVTGNLSFCEGGQTQITAQGAVAYQWNTGATTPSLELNSGGTYSVSGTSAYGCVSTAQVTVNQHPLPIPMITGNSSICDGETGVLTASGGATYFWSNGVSTATINPTTAGTYTVTVIDQHGCSDSLSTILSVRPTPQVTIVGDSAFCQGSNLILTATSTNQVNYTWNNGTTGSSISINTPGIYSVTATDVNGCIAIVTKNVVQKSIPVVQITGNLSPCLGTSTNLTAAGAAQYVWSNGSTNSTITVTPSASTQYSLTATGSNGCVKTTSVVVNPLPLPTAAISGGTPICEGSSAVLTATGGNQYLWSTGVNSNSITVSNAGTYTVTVTNSLGCSVSTSVSLIVNPNPTASINGESTVCEGNVLTLEATGGASYLWSNQATTSIITVNPTASTSYSCTVSNAHGCSVVVNKPVNVNPLPVPQLYGSDYFCEGGEMTLIAVGGDSYQWNTGDTTSQIEVSTSGLYSVTVSLDGCSATTHRYINSSPLPVVTITDPLSICSGSVATLQATGGISYLWSNDSHNPTIQVTDGGFYSVTVTDAQGCTNTASTTVTLLPAPNLQLTGNLTICAGDTTYISGGGADLYEWSTGETSPTIMLAPVTTSTYSVTGTNLFGCSQSSLFTVVVNPVYSITKSAEICQGATYNGSGFTIPQQNQAGEFFFYRNLTTVAGCDSIIRLTLTVNPKPVLPQSISGTAIIHTPGNYTYVVHNPQYANSFEWSISNPTWTLSPSTSSSVNLTVNTNGYGTLSVYGVNECGVSVPATLSIQSTVSVDEFESDLDIAIFPNPTQSDFQITVSDDLKGTHFVLRDLSGKQLDYVIWDGSSTSYSASSLSVGLYFIEFYNQDQLISVKKLIKQ